MITNGIFKSFVICALIFPQVTFSRTKSMEKSASICGANSEGLNHYAQLGQGSVSSPFEIYNEDQFRSLQQLSGSDYGKHFIQCRDISFTYLEKPEFFIKIFQGHYNGNAKGLNNFTHSNAPGMIQTIRGSFKNSWLINFSINYNVPSDDSGPAVGALAAIADNGIILDDILLLDSNVRSGGDIKLHAGGLIGIVKNGGLINRIVVRNEKSNAPILDVRTARNCGGVVGMSVFGKMDIKNIQIGDESTRINMTCSASNTGGAIGTITSKNLNDQRLLNVKASMNIFDHKRVESVGGVAGNADKSLLQNVEFSGDINATHLVDSGSTQVKIGSLVGWSIESKITYSKSLAAILFRSSKHTSCSASSAIGGLIGLMKGGELSWSKAEASSRIEISNFFGGVGGLVGYMQEKSLVASSFSRMNFALSSAQGTIDLGGAIGRIGPLILSADSSSIKDIYSDFSYEISSPTPIRVVGGSVGLIAEGGPYSSQDLFQNSIATINQASGGTLPEASSIIGSRNEGKFIGGPWTLGSFVFTGDDSMNFLKSMNCHQASDMFCNAGVAHSDSYHLFNRIIGPIKFWEWGDLKWAQPDEAGSFPDIPSAGSIFPDTL
jgi:hypothetical protein